MTSREYSRSRLADKIGHLLEHFLNYKSRWQNLLLFADLKTIEHLIELFRQSIEPHHVVIAVLFAQQPMRIGHERRKLILHAKELVNRIIMPLPLFALGLDLEKPIQNPCGKLLRSRLPTKRGAVELWSGA